MENSEKEGAPPPTPALATTVSMRPIFSTASTMPAATASSSATLTTWVSTRTPIGFSCASASAFFCALEPQTTTSAPAWASASTMPKPMPPLPPVTSATFPVRSNGA